jgi:hypothetical protein
MIFRAALAGGILFIDDPLLYYRTGGMSFHERETHGHSVLFGGRIKILSWRVSSARCYLQDLSVCGVDAGDIDTQYLRDFIHRHEWEIDLSRAGWFPERLMMMPEAFTRSHASRSFKPLRCYLKYLAWPVYLVFLNLRGAPKKGSPE